MFKRSLFFVTYFVASVSVAQDEIVTIIPATATVITQVSKLDQAKELFSSLSTQAAKRFADLTTRMNEMYSQAHAQTSTFVAQSVQPTAQAAYEVVLKNKTAAIVAASTVSLVAAYAIYKKYFAKPTTK